MLSCTPPTLLNTRVAAQALGVQPRTLEDWRRRGGGPAYIRLSATCVRYSLDSLQAWLNERTATSTAQEAARELRAASGADVDPGS